MAKGQENGTIILLGLKDCKVGEVWGGEDSVMVKTEVKGTEKCPHCGSGRLYPHGECKPREVLHTWSNGKKVYLELHRGGGSAAIANIPLLREGNWCGRVPGLPDWLKQRPYGSSKTETSAR